MIDTQFIIRYTDGLYSCDPDYAPTYQEFRDMFSSGQLKSKIWLVDELKALGIVNIQNLIVCGCWFGTLAFMLRKAFPDIAITCLDIDPRCEKFIDSMIYTSERSKFQILREDMFDYTYIDEDIIVNTSCEHIENLGDWLDMLEGQKIVVLQTNNFRDCEGHINCVDSLSEFKEKVGPYVQDILYEGLLTTPMYTRFMIIARTK